MRLHATATEIVVYMLRRLFLVFGTLKTIAAQTYIELVEIGLAHCFAATKFHVARGGEL